MCLQDEEDEGGNTLPPLPYIEPWVCRDETVPIALEVPEGAAPPPDPRPYKRHAEANTGGRASPPRPQQVALPEFARPGAAAAREAAAQSLLRQGSAGSDLSWSESPRRKGQGGPASQPHGTPWQGAPLPIPPRTGLELHRP